MPIIFYRLIPGADSRFQNSQGTMAWIQPALTKKSIAFVLGGISHVGACPLSSDCEYTDQNKQSCTKSFKTHTPCTNCMGSNDNGASSTDHVVHGPLSPQLPVGDGEPIHGFYDSWSPCSNFLPNQGVGNSPVGIGFIWESFYRIGLIWESFHRKLLDHNNSNNNNNQ